MEKSEVEWIRRQWEDVLSGKLFGHLSANEILMCLVRDTIKALKELEGKS